MRLRLLGQENHITIAMADSSNHIISEIFQYIPPILNQGQLQVKTFSDLCLERYARLWHISALLIVNGIIFSVGRTQGSLGQDSASIVECVGITVFQRLPCDAPEERPAASLSPKVGEILHPGLGIRERSRMSQSLGEKFVPGYVPPPSQPEHSIQRNSLPSIDDKSGTMGEFRV